MSTPTLLIRADATAQMGTGHVMRCLALAQAWQDQGGRAIFAEAELLSALRDRLICEGFEVNRVEAPIGGPTDTEMTARLATRLGASWLVLDGYHFDSRFQQAIKLAVPRVLAIDDYCHCDLYSADLVLNQNLCARVDAYADRATTTELLLGTRYALLRREFVAYRGWGRTIPEVGRRVLVTLGGADPDNVTLKVVHALGRVGVDGLEAVVVAGGGSPHLAELEAAIRESSARVRLFTNVSDMAALMAWADVAVAAAGSTSWERALLGLPTLILVLADNQEAIGTACHHHKLGRNLGWYHRVTPELIAESLCELLMDSEARTVMAQRGREAVDGQGASRVVEVLRLRS